MQLLHAGIKPTTRNIPLHLGWPRQGGPLQGVSYVLWPCAVWVGNGGHSCQRVRGSTVAGCATGSPYLVRWEGKRRMGREARLWRRSCSPCRR
jgi:hypothetical protein